MKTYKRTFEPPKQEIVEPTSVRPLSPASLCTNDSTFDGYAIHLNEEYPYVNVGYDEDGDKIVFFTNVKLPDTLVHPDNLPKQPVQPFNIIDVIKEIRVASQKSAEHSNSLHSSHSVAPVMDIGLKMAKDIAEHLRNKGYVVPTK